MNQYLAIIAVLFVLVLFVVGCKQFLKKEDLSKETKAKKNIMTLQAPIVIKNFRSKKGKETKHKEYYLRASMGDYFIKFCESKVSKLDLQKALEQKEDDLIKALSLEVEFLEGLLDQCDSEIEVQSRMGRYIIIHRILE